jgi:hypothetical protein
MNWHSRIAIVMLIAGAGAGAQTAERRPTAMASKEEKQLLGTWRHSHEEDTASESVYRPDSYEFPPARGRTGYEFRSDHSCTFLGISPRDGTAKQSCKWELRLDQHPAIVITFPDGREEILPLVLVDGERMVVKKSGG